MNNMHDSIQTYVPIDVIEETLILGEGFKTEYKKTIESSQSVARSICAFSNAMGGNILIGIDSSGRPFGVSDKNAELSKIEEALSIILPRPVVSIQSSFIKDRELLLIKVREGEKKPYFISTGHDPTAFIRTGTVNTRATRKTLKYCVNMKSDYSRRTKHLSKEELIIYDLFEIEQNLAPEQIKSQLQFTNRKIRKSLRILQKAGLIESDSYRSGSYCRIDPLT